MAFSDIWNKCNLSGKKVVLLGLLLLGCGVANAQTIVRENYLKYDQRRIRFGFFVAVNQARYKLQHSSEFIQQLSDTSFGDPNLQVNPYPTYNFSLGFISNLHLLQYLDLRFTPGVGFYRRGVEYKGAKIFQSPIKNGLEEKVVESAMVELPLLLKLKSKRRKNVRLYFVGGIKQSIDVINRKNDQSERETNLQGKASDFSVEYGVGADLYYPYFKFGPELRFSHGLGNVLLSDPTINNPYSKAIQRLSTHTVTLLLQFE